MYFNTYHQRHIFDLLRCRQQLQVVTHVRAYRTTYLSHCPLVGLLIQLSSSEASYEDFRLAVIFHLLPALVRPPLL